MRRLPGDFLNGRDRRRQLGGRGTRGPLRLPFTALRKREMDSLLSRRAEQDQSEVLIEEPLLLNQAVEQRTKRRHLFVDRPALWAVPLRQQRQESAQPRRAHQRVDRDVGPPAAT